MCPAFERDAQRLGGMTFMQQSLCNNMVSTGTQQQKPAQRSVPARHFSVVF
jgi:hypothetical protein